MLCILSPFDLLKQRHILVPLLCMYGVYISDIYKIMAEPEVLLNLSVNYIPKSVDEFELRDLFKKHGSVESIKWFMDRKTGSNLGNGFVKYRTAKTAADGRPLSQSTTYTVTY